MNAGCVDIMLRSDYGVIWRNTLRYVAFIRLHKVHFGHSRQIALLAIAISEIEKMDKFEYSDK